MRAMVLRDGRLEVRDTADPVPGPGQLLLRPLSAAICASDVHYMDHPDSAPRFVWDSGRDTIMGHEFIGEVVGHGPECSGDFPVGSRVTSLPLLIREGAEPHVIGHDPDAPGAFGELMLVSEVLARTVPDGVPNDAVAVVDAFAVGEFYVRSSAIGPGELPLVIGAGAIGLSAVAALVARGVGPVIISDYSAERLEYAKKFGAEVLVNPGERSPFEVWREVARDSGFRQRRSSLSASARRDCFRTSSDRATSWRGSTPLVAGTEAIQCRSPRPPTKVSPFSSAAARIPSTGTARWTRSSTVASTRCPASAK